MDKSSVPALQAVQEKRVLGTGKRVSRVINDSSDIAQRLLTGTKK
jgi:hypothetical protein